MTPGNSLEVDPLELPGVRHEPTRQRLAVAENQLSKLGFDATGMVSTAELRANPLRIAPAPRGRVGKEQSRIHPGGVRMETHSAL